MRVQLKDMLAGERMRRPKIQCEAAINSPAQDIGKIPKRGHTRLR